MGVLAVHLHGRVGYGGRRRGQELGDESVEFLSVGVVGGFAGGSGEEEEVVVGRPAFDEVDAAGSYVFGVVELEPKAPSALERPLDLLPVARRHVHQLLIRQHRQRLHFDVKLLPILGNAPQIPIPPSLHPLHARAPRSSQREIRPIAQGPVHFVGEGRGVAGADGVVGGRVVGVHGDDVDLIRVAGVLGEGDGVDEGGGFEDVPSQEGSVGAGGGGLGGGLRRGLGIRNERHVQIGHEAVRTGLALDRSGGGQRGEQASVEFASAVDDGGFLRREGYGVDVSQQGDFELSFLLEEGVVHAGEGDEGGARFGVVGRAESAGVDQPDRFVLMIVAVAVAVGERVLVEMQQPRRSVAVAVAGISDTRRRSFERGSFGPRQLQHSEETIRRGQVRPAIAPLLLKGRAVLWTARLQMRPEIARPVLGILHPVIEVPAERAPGEVHQVARGVVDHPAREGIVVEVFQLVGRQVVQQVVPAAIIIGIVIAVVAAALFLFFFFLFFQNLAPIKRSVGKIPRLEAVRRKARQIERRGHVGGVVRRVDVGLAPLDGRRFDGTQNVGRVGGGGDNVLE
mmetsp:Transcript_15071/g.30682  ORF Transcript_15071/g.30682 Transcript_15071/m.30682 type:complete len:568 (-) Transcript_15071:108-1811(-)